jgi:aldose 1-epimerase
MPPSCATLTDPATGSSARVLTGFGFNCFEFRAVVEGEEIDVLWAVDDFEQGAARPSSSGIPLLFPFPGRIRGTVMNWRGKGYQLEEGDGRGNAIHGFVHARPWRVVSQSGQEVTGQFQASIDEPSLLARWPSDFRVTATYRLRGNELGLTLTIENPGQEELPFGLGTHPYFRVPLGGGDVGGGDAADCVIRVPVGERWELDGMIASGCMLPLGPEHALDRGLRFGDAQLDAGFSKLAFDGERCLTEIHDPGSGRTLRQTFDRTFRECVVYNPPHRQAICIEPYSCICDPFRLEAEGVEAGLRILAPGDSFTAQVEIAVD